MLKIAILAPAFTFATLWTLTASGLFVRMQEIALVLCQ